MTAASGTPTPSNLTVEEVEELQNEICAENGWTVSEIGRFQAICDAALLGLEMREGRNQVIEECAELCSHKAFLCHTHDERGKGAEWGMLECMKALRAMLD